MYGHQHKPTVEKHVWTAHIKQPNDSKDYFEAKRLDPRVANLMEPRILIFLPNIANFEIYCKERYGTKLPSQITLEGFSSTYICGNWFYRISRKCVGGTFYYLERIEILLESTFIE